MTVTAELLREQIYPRFSGVMQREEIYLANHSLGRPLDRMSSDVQRGLDLWYSKMDEAWEPWQSEMDLWRGNVAKLLGAADANAIVPKTSAGQGLRAVLNAFPQDRPVRVVTTRGEFDSIDFILKTYASRDRAVVDWVEPTASEEQAPLFEAEAIADRLVGEPGLLVVSAVFFGTSQILGALPELIAEAHRKGWLVLVDLYHAAGVIPLDFASLDADFGIGGSYKYLRGGPGACWLALGPDDRRAHLRSLDTGWFAKEHKFGYERSDEPQFQSGGNGWLESTPPVLMPYQAKSGLEFTLELGVERLREFSLDQQAKMRTYFDRAGAKLFSPSNPQEFGAFSLLHHPNAPDFCSKLKSNGVNADSRGSFVRFGPDILTSDEELEGAAKIVAKSGTSL